MNNNWTWRTGFRAAAASEQFDSIEQSGNAGATGNMNLSLFQQPTLGQSYYLGSSGRLPHQIKCLSEFPESL